MLVFGFTAAAVLVAAPFFSPSWILFLLTLALAKFVVVAGVALFLRAGLVSFGHALFYAAGAYTAAFAYKGFGVREALVLLPAGLAVGAAFACVLGLLVARYRGVFFAMLNLAFSMILYAVLLKFYWTTGGTDGLGVASPTILGILPPRSVSRVIYYYLTLGVAGAVVWFTRRFLRSPLGYYLKAMADNEIRIEYSGESVRRVIYRTYMISGMLGGLSGVLVAFTVGHVVPEYAFWFQSGEFVFIALLGGYGTVPGPLVGSFAFEFIRTYASKYAPEAWQLVLGVIMLAIILFKPGGLWALICAPFPRRQKGEGPDRA